MCSDEDLGGGAKTFHPVVVLGGYQKSGAQDDDRYFPYD